MTYTARVKNLNGKAIISLYRGPYWVDDFTSVAALAARINLADLEGITS